MKTHAEPPSPPREAPVATIAPRGGGLLLRRHLKEMTPVFTAFLTVLFADLLLLVFLPYALGKGTDSPWGTSTRVAYMAVSMLSGLGFGLLASVVAERRGHSAWWFLAGHIGVLAAPIVAAAGLVESQPVMARLVVFGLGMAGTVVSFLVVQNFPVRSDGGQNPELSVMTRALGRFWHAVGNIWFGIALLSCLAAAWHFGTRWESLYGSRSAHFLFYNATWYGALLAAFSASLLAATLRKYPWRVDQTGWIVVHTALILLLIGSFASYFGKVEGTLALFEGESSDSFAPDSPRYFAVYEMRASTNKPVLVWRERTAFDRDASEDSPGARHTVTEGGSKLFDLTVEKFFGDGLPSVRRTDDGKVPRPALDLELVLPNGAIEEVELVAEDRERAVVSLGPLQMALMSAPWPLMAEALRGGRDPLNKGHLVVRKRDGGEVLRLPLEPAARAPDSRAPAVISVEAIIPDTEIRVRTAQWFDRLDIGNSHTSDLSPGYPSFPALSVILEGPEGTDRRLALAFMPQWAQQDGAAKLYKDYEVLFDYLPAWPVDPGELIFAAVQDGEFVYAFGSREGERHAGTVKLDQELALGTPLKVIPKQTFTHLAEELVYRKNEAAPKREAALVRIGDQSFWLRPTGSKTFQHDGRTFRLGWEQDRIPLGFDLTLRDFHRDFYPGSSSARTFESYLWLNEPNTFSEPVGIKIDMNHPLRFQGWRLFQSRFDASTEREQTVLQINRDPGLAITYPASALLCLGLIIVFLQKPFLRALAKFLDRRQAGPGRKLVAALLTVGLSLLATLPGVAMIVFIPEGALLGLGAVLVVVGVILESCWLHYRTRVRLEERPTDLTPTTTP